MIFKNHLQNTQKGFAEALLQVLLELKPFTALPELAFHL
jgi:hypothetical protein